MPAHDAYLRLTPYERFLPGADFAEAHFGRIAAEVEQHPEALDDPGAFALLEASRRALAELRDPGAGEDDHGATHALLLFHAFHLERAGAPHLLITVPVSRWAVEGEGGGPAGDAGLPPASYVQLPQHLFWIRDDEDERPASLDGFFWTVRGPTLHLMGVAGLQGPAGEGFRVLPLPGVPRADAALWLSETMRESGEDFRSEMPGAELEGLYELRTAGELLKLAARIDGFVERFPGRAPGVEGEGGVPPSPGPSPAGLAYTRITLTSDRESSNPPASEAAGTDPRGP